MNLSNGFARRKQLQAEIETWTNRLRYAGQNRKQYQTLKIEGEGSFDAVPGSIKQFNRNYTIEECKEKVEKLIKEDQVLALRISLTNQIAKSTIIDLDGKEREMTIPELLVLKNEISPKLETLYRAVPLRKDGVEVIDERKDSIKWRTIKPQYKTEETTTEKGNVMKNNVIELYNVEEIEDFGFIQRELYDEIDKLHNWQQQLKEAINKANETELVEL